jgi:malate dehydrogenase (oxaloacetate-decarboxylating)
MTTPLQYHQGGKIGVRATKKISTRKQLALAYTPGVAEACMAIQADPRKAFDYTMKANSVAIVTDSTRVLGLGRLRPEAALPVMEGKAALFKLFGDVDAFPLCPGTQDKEEFIKFAKLASPGFGAINLEDIESPKVLEIEKRLEKELDIPVFHDDQHGTAVVATAALLNALRVTGRKPEDTAVVISGAGAAGIGIANLLLRHDPFKDIVVCDTKGILEPRGANPWKDAIAKRTNKRRRRGTLADAMRGADVLIGVSAPGIVTRRMVESMAARPIILAMANPIPEIMPADARAAGAAVVGTGRSDFPNQINNSLAFPGILRGTLDCMARRINTKMLDAAAEAIAACVPRPTAKRIVPDMFDPKTPAKVASAVARAAMQAGVARKGIKDLKRYEKTVAKRIREARK